MASRSAIPGSCAEWSTISAGPPPSEGDPFPREGQVVAQDSLAVPGGGESGLDRCREVVQHAVAVREQVPVRPPQLERAGARLLVRHAQGAVAHRPHVHVAGIEEVVHVPVEVREAAFVEPPRDRLPEHVHERDLPLAVPRIGGRRRGREEVGRVPAHLVEIHHDLGPEFEEDVHLAARLGLTLDEEVPVQVEQVVVPPAARPRLVVLGGDPDFVGPPGLGNPVLVHEAVAPVGILHGVDEDEGFRENQFDVRISLGREQVVGLGHGGAAGTDLVPVHAVHERRHDGQLVQKRLGFSLGERAGVREPRESRLHLVEPRHAARRSDHEDDEGTPPPSSPRSE